MWGMTNRTVGEEINSGEDAMSGLGLCVSCLVGAKKRERETTQGRKKRQGKKKQQQQNQDRSSIDAYLKTDQA